MKRSRRIVIASADHLMLESLPHLLRSAGWDIAAATPDGVNALAAAARSEIDAVLIVNQLDRLSPAHLARELRRQRPGLSVVVVGDPNFAGSLPDHAAAEAVLRAVETAPDDPIERSDPKTPVWIEQLASLTPRERSILKLLGSGLTMPQVARHLGLSDHTVRTHMQKLYAKLGCHSRLDVIRFATRHGIVDGGQI